ncbi:CapA family protein [Streptomyces sp. TRM66268-LWL]|uniref:CapA family protein n=1 Tax=Streptomyces polyasparticus TaxID=2767826 RepID=A0ABR7SE93_9ACTN|nr:CapA family protein [Streptomyces polyasparticus]MBC9713811.1 CapA family protein [Streptomyces polyasparticus]
MTERTGSFRAHTARAALAALLTAAVVGCSAGQPDPAPGPESSKKPPAPSAAGGPAPAPAKGFTLVASGDVLPHASIIRQANADAGGDGYDFRPMLLGVKPVISKADLAICHMETVYGANGDYTGYPAFKSPPQVAAALAATGYDSCSTASNHTLDAGAAGIRRTLDALDKAGVRHAGSARSAAEAKRPTILRAGGAKVAHLAYSYGTNGYPLPKGQPWALNLINEKKIIADARAARRAGADVVVVSPHWGTEWQDAPDARQLRLAKRLTASKTGGRPDIDLIIGTHAHVPQPYEKVNGTWVIYGMGDQIAGEMINYSGSSDPRGNQGTIGRFTFVPPQQAGGRWQVSRAEFIPQWFDTGDGRVVNLNAAIKRGADYTDLRDRIRRITLSRGGVKDGLMMGS